MPNIHVDPARIEEAEKKVEAVRTAFETSLGEAKSAVDACEWTGAAADAFHNMFEEARTQFDGVMEQISGIASALKAGRDGLVTTDEQIAAGLA